MPRPPRIYIPDVSEHVWDRGINHGAIFGNDSDKEHLLELIVSAMDCRDVAVHAFALMTTHYHLIVTPPAEGVLSEAMQEIGACYTRYFNREYGRTGTLWNERFNAVPLDSERYWYNCLRYVDLNPFAARMCATPEAYPWSSYRVHAFGEACDWLTPHPLYLVLGSTAEERQEAYRAICEIPLTEVELALLRRPPPRRVELVPAGV